MKVSGVGQCLIHNVYIYRPNQCNGVEEGAQLGISKKGITEEETKQRTILIITAIIKNFNSSNFQRQ